LILAFAIVGAGFLSIDNTFSKLIALIIYILALWLEVALGSRRLKDIGYSGAAAWFLLLPPINIFIFFYLAVVPSKENQNN
jgi:uncharacterized membrane protein YhaH (DUF805 family)